MTICSEMRDRMLEAELAELRGEIGDSALARHVADCEACSVVARALVDDTAALAHLVAGRPARLAARTRRRRSRTVRRGAAIVALPLAAAVALVLIREPRPSIERETGVASSAAPDAPVGQPAATSESVVPAASPAAPRLPAASTTATRAAPSSPAGSHDPAPGTAVATINLQGSSAMPPRPRADGHLRLTPAAGSRALVMRTRDPAVTVVWIY